MKFRLATPREFSWWQVTLASYGRWSSLSENLQNMTLYLLLNAPMRGLWLLIHDVVCMYSMNGWCES